MAIFSMNNEENELFDESGDVLDNMLEACDQMLDALNEHGGARNRYVKMLADKADAVDKKINAINHVGTGSDAHKKLLDKYNKERDDLHKKADRYLAHGTHGNDGSDIEFDKKISVRNKIENFKNAAGKNQVYNINGNRGYEGQLGARALSRSGKKAFYKDFGGPQEEDRFAEKQKRHDEEKKKAIKETCLTILSMIDDI